MLFNDVLTDFLAYCRHEKNLAPRTVIAYRFWGNTFSAWADQDKVEPDFTLRFSLPVMRRWMYSLSKGGKRPRTIHNAACCLRAIGDFAISNELITLNHARSLTLPKKDAADRPLVSDHELGLLLLATERQADMRLVARDRCIFSILTYCGVRFQELLDIRCQDVALDFKTVLIASGKGRKPRTLYPNDLCRAALAEWMRERKKMTTKHDWLFAYDLKRRIGDDGLRALLTETKARAGLADHKNIQFHAIRRGYATRCLAKGMDLRSLSASMGHSSPTTTLIYTFASERPAEAMRDYSDLRLEGDENPELVPSKPQAPKPSRADQNSRMRRRTTQGGVR